MEENNWKLEDFAVEKTKDEKSVSSSIICKLQSETKKYLWLSVDRYRKSSPFSWDFWEFIGGKINSPMDHQVGTPDGQGEGLQVVGVGAPWPVYLERMEKCYVLEPLVI